MGKETAKKIHYLCRDLLEMRKFNRALLPAAKAYLNACSLDPVTALDDVKMSREEFSKTKAAVRELKGKKTGTSIIEMPDEQFGGELD